MKKLLIIFLLLIHSSSVYAFTGSGIFQFAGGAGDGSAPVISNALPATVQPCTSNPRNITLQITTDENATCKYNATDASYDSMSNTFSTTGATSHSQVVSLNCDASYTYYTRCMDSSSNKNTSSTSIAFSVNDPIWIGSNGQWNLANTTWTDTSGSGNNLTMGGTLTATSGHSGGSNLAAASFSGSNKLYINDNASLSITGSITMSAWINLSSVATGVNNIIFEKGVASGQYSYDFFVWNTGKVLYCRLSNNGTTTVAAYGATAVGIGAWHHAACVYNGTDIRVYLDGSLDSNSTNNPKTYSSGIYNGNEAFNVGWMDNGIYNNMHGYIDDAAIWSRALSSTEISTLYGGGDDFSGL